MNIHDAASPREKRCALLQAVVTPTVAQWVNEQAQAEDRSVSDYLRRLIEAHRHSLQRSEVAAPLGRNGR
jgi:hypothetical protein